MNHGAIAGINRRIALLGNHLPRHCGIATFTTDLTDALGAAFPDLACSVVAMNDRGKARSMSRRGPWAAASPAMVASSSGSWPSKLCAG